MRVSGASRMGIVHDLQRRLMKPIFDVKALHCPAMYSVGLNN